MALKKITEFTRNAKEKSCFDEMVNSNILLLPARLDDVITASEVPVSAEWFQWLDIMQAARRHYIN